MRKQTKTLPQDLDIFIVNLFIQKLVKYTNQLVPILAAEFPSSLVSTALSSKLCAFVCP